MITFKHPEYRRLGIESSNLMLHYDGELLQGNYEEAGQSLWRAGLLRLEMSRMSREHDDPGRAMCDALSAASCLIRAGDALRARRALAEVAAQGPIPPERLDISDAQEERSKELQKLLREQKRFLKEFNRHPEWLQTPDDAALAFVAERRGDFPGWGLLYGLLAYLEHQTGDTAAAVRHALLAAELGPENPLLVLIAAALQAENESPTAARAWGWERLTQLQDSPSRELLRAFLLLQHPKSLKELQEAFPLLQSLVRGPDLDFDQRAIALALLVVMAERLGETSEHAEAIHELRALGSRPRKHNWSPCPNDLDDLIEAFATPGPSSENHRNGTATTAPALLRRVERALILSHAIDAAA